MKIHSKPKGAFIGALTSCAKRIERRGEKLREQGQIFHYGLNSSRPKTASLFKPHKPLFPLLSLENSGQLPLSLMIFRSFCIPNRFQQVPTGSDIQPASRAWAVEPPRSRWMDGSAPQNSSASPRPFVARGIPSKVRTPLLE